MQSKVIPSLFDLMENCRKIEYLFVFDVGQELGELVWCSSYIIDISNGTDFEKYRWRSGKTKKSKVMEEGWQLMLNGHTCLCGDLVIELKLE